MARQIGMPPHIKKNPIYRDIYRRLYNYNKNFMCCYCGGTGDGKSYAAIRTAFDLDLDYNNEPRFNIDKVIFLPSDFLKLIRSTLSKGSFIVWDETGVGLNTKEWYSLKNRLMSYTIQTFRFRNLGVLYTVPAMSFVESQVRVLFHAAVTMSHVSKVDKRGVGTFEWMQFNPKTGKIYNKKPRYYIDGRKTIIDSVRFGLPPKDFIEQYEEKKREMSKDWYSLYAEQLELMKKTVEQKERETKKTVKSSYEEVLSRLPEFWDPKKGQVSAGLIMVKLEPAVNKDQAYAISGTINSEINSGKIDVPTMLTHKPAQK